jgi:hypothetical protein
MRYESAGIVISGEQEYGAFPARELWQGRHFEGEIADRAPEDVDFQERFRFAFERFLHLKTYVGDDQLIAEFVGLVPGVNFVNRRDDDLFGAA